MKTIVCYGDSNTHGCNPDYDVFTWDLNGKVNLPVRFGPHERWTGVLADSLNAAEYRIVEEGLPGRTTMFCDSALPYRTGRDYIVPCLLSHAPVELLIIMLGTNDLKACYSPSEVALGMGMDEFMKIVKNLSYWDNGELGEILLVAPPPIHDSLPMSRFSGMFNENSVHMSKRLAALYRQIASLHGVNFLDAGEHISVSQVDCIHFSLESHQTLGKVMALEVKRLLGPHE